MHVGLSRSHLKGIDILSRAFACHQNSLKLFRLSDISSVSVTDALLNIFSRMGFPREIQCDQNTSFTSALTTEFFERFGILVRHIVLCIIHRVVRFHRTLKRLLRVLCLDAGFEWDKHLPSILLALRTVSHESTGEYRGTVRVGVWEKFANPRDVGNGTLDGTGRRK
ncbi:retrovirus-related Pol polyprotein from transposon 412 [Trichonephila clavipes]|nr:retrovirus-related Pol polyprotein from transposon 412 [Trichonephila clavipes]